jgi:hypothetical protein
MIGLLKIGFTNDEIIDYRITDLRTTGVPEPFKLEAYTRVNNPNEVERQIHKIVDEYRLNKDREFFRISFDKLLEILKEKLPDIEWDLEKKYNLIKKECKDSWYCKITNEVSKLEININNFENYALTKNWGGDDINDPYGGVYYDNISKYNYIKIRIGQLRDALSKRPSVIDENVDGTITYNKGLYLKEDDKECKILFKKILEDFEKLKTSIN